MQTKFTFKKITPSTSLKSYLQKKLNKFDKMLDAPADAHIVLSTEKIRHIAEVTLNCDRLKIHAREESESIYSSIDALIDKIKSQIKKNREKIRLHKSGNKKSIKKEISESESYEQVSDEIMTETIDYKPMDVEDAVIELNSGKQNFFVFSNARTKHINVLYRHHNGGLGLIQPKGQFAK